MPHAKTHRTLEVGRLQLTSGANGLTLAKLGEAEALVAAETHRVVLAYPLIGPNKLDRALALAQRAEIVLAVDSIEGARALTERFAEAAKRTEIYIIVDSGLHREGVLPRDAAGLAREVMSLSALEPVGIMTHEGVVYQASNREDLRRRAKRLPLSWSHPRRGSVSLVSPADRVDGVERIGTPCRRYRAPARRACPGGPEPYLHGFFELGGVVCAPPRELRRPVARAGGGSVAVSTRLGD